MRTGVLAGVYLTGVMVVALVAANRLPALEPFADLRNWICRGVFLIFALVPIGTFFRAPWKLFVSGASGWLVFTLGYSVAAVVFDNLHTRLNISNLHMLFLGVGSYALVAVALWVVESAKLTIEHTLAHSHSHSRAARPNE
ncbi:MAG TPA: hypothetical protein VL099_10875 [Candidatus Binatia bacterium]|nr:hypothetical protein [Candidatus Binatia bacterium]